MHTKAFMSDRTWSILAAPKLFGGGGVSPPPVFGHRRVPNPPHLLFKDSGCGVANLPRFFHLFSYAGYLWCIAVGGV